MSAEETETTIRQYLDALLSGGDFASFFADVSERPVGRQEQTPLPGPDQEAELKKLDARLAAAQKTVPPVDAELAKWEESVKGNQPEWTVLTCTVEEISNGGQRYLPQKDGSFVGLGYAPTDGLTRAFENVKALMAAGADVSARASNGETALSIARREHDKRIIELLKQSGAHE